MEQNEILHNDIDIIISLITIYDRSKNSLAEDIEASIKKLTEIKITRYELYKIFNAYDMTKEYRPNERIINRVAHAVLFIKYNDIKLSIGYNSSNKTLSFARDNKSVRFLKFSDNEDVYLGIKSTLVRLLKIEL
jgi:50S ribosomal subunit-associated GTPase HflX